MAAVAALWGLLAAEPLTAAHWLLLGGGGLVTLALCRLLLLPKGKQGPLLGLTVLVAAGGFGLLQLLALPLIPTAAEAAALTAATAGPDGDIAAAVRALTTLANQPAAAKTPFLTLQTPPPALCVTPVFAVLRFLRWLGCDSWPLVLTAARAAGLLTFAGAAALAVRLAPSAKPLFFSAALAILATGLPLRCNALCGLLTLALPGFAQLLAVLQSPDALPRGAWWGLRVLALLLVLLYPAALPLLLLGALLPARRWKRLFVPPREMVAQTAGETDEETTEDTTEKPIARTKTSRREGSRDRGTPGGGWQMAEGIFCALALAAAAGLAAAVWVKMPGGLLPLPAEGGLELTLPAGIAAAEIPTAVATVPGDNTANTANTADTTNTANSTNTANTTNTPAPGDKIPSQTAGRQKGESYQTDGGPTLLTLLLHSDGGQPALVLTPQQTPDGQRAFVDATPPKAPLLGCWPQLAALALAWAPLAWAPLAWALVLAAAAVRPADTLPPAPGARGVVALTAVAQGIWLYCGMFASAPPATLVLPPRPLALATLVVPLAWAFCPHSLSRQRDTEKSVAFAACALLFMQTAVGFISTI